MSSNKSRIMQVVWFKRDLRVHDHRALARVVPGRAPQGMVRVQITDPGWSRGGRSRRGAVRWTDLKRRGMLDETLVVWGGEFGRQPTAEYAVGTGRDHNSYGFTMKSSIPEARHRW